MIGERATRRRAQVLAAVIREAVLAELAQGGYAGVTFEGIARRAATGKPVLYRRYRSRAHMVLDAIASEAPPFAPSDTGTLRGDVQAVLLSAVRFFRQTDRQILRGLIAEADDDLLAEVNVMTWVHAGPAFEAALGAARERGEIGSAEVPARVVTLPITVLRHDLLFTPAAVDEHYVDELIDGTYLPLVTSLAGRQGVE